jgi:hypothetical protein
VAAQYQRLAEIASNPEIKQHMFDMAAYYQAKADEDNTPISSDVPPARGCRLVSGEERGGGS